MKNFYLIFFLFNFINAAEVQNCTNILAKLKDLEKEIQELKSRISKLEKQKVDDDSDNIKYYGDDRIYPALTLR